MKEQNSLQLELFSQENRSGQPTSTKSGSFLSCVYNYEKVIMAAIFFIVVGVVCFSLGIEQGKRIVRQVLPVLSPALKPVIKQETVTPKPLPMPVPENYTIQVASYQSKISAQKDAQQLQKRGLSVLILSKGRFLVLYAGKFPNKQSAASLLTELRKQYRDCFVRRM